MDEREATAFLEISVPTIRRWEKQLLIKKYREGGRVFYLREELSSLKDAYATTKRAATVISCSDSYLRRLCREGKIAGTVKVSKKAYWIPWSWVHERSKAKLSSKNPRKSSGQMRNQSVVGFGTTLPQNPFLA